MKVLILKNKTDIAKKVSDIFSKVIKKKLKCALGLASGKTMIPIYKELVKRYKKGKIDFSKTTTFNLDEYANINKNDGKSLHYFMNKHLFSKININKKNVNFPDSNLKNYEEEIKKRAIDLQLLGIGKNGHIGFNEPGSSFSSTTRKVKLSEGTKRANKISIDYAYTMGIKTIMKSKKIILIAIGKEKADAVARSVNGMVTEEIPASILRMHKNAIFILDKKAASKLKNIK